MKYLILPIEEGERLNHEKAVERGCLWEGANWWADERTETEVALIITDEAEYTEDCIDVLPDRFVTEIISEEK